MGWGRDQGVKQYCCSSFRERVIRGYVRARPSPPYQSEGRTLRKKFAFYWGDDEDEQALFDFCPWCRSHVTPVDCDEAGAPVIRGEPIPTIDGALAALEDSE